MSVSCTWKTKAKCLNDEELQAQLHDVRKNGARDPFFDNPDSNWGKKYCGDCEVRLACLAEAMKSLQNPVFDQEQGIWGGLSSKARKGRRRKSQRQVLLQIERMKGLSPDNDNPIAS